MQRYVVLDKEGSLCFEGTELDLKEYVEETLERNHRRLRRPKDFFKEFTVYETSGKVTEIKL